jgi:hypothetical protein
MLFCGDVARSQLMEEHKLCYVHESSIIQDVPEIRYGFLNVIYHLS